MYKRWFVNILSTFRITIHKNVVKNIYKKNLYPHCFVTFSMWLSPYWPCNNDPHMLRGTFCVERACADDSAVNAAPTRFVHQPPRHEKWVRNAIWRHRHVSLPIELLESNFGNHNTNGPHIRVWRRLDVMGTRTVRYMDRAAQTSSDWESITNVCFADTIIAQCGDHQHFLVRLLFTGWIGECYKHWGEVWLGITTRKMLWNTA